MADAMDSKSIDRKVVRVRLSPRPLIIMKELTRNNPELNRLCKKDLEILKEAIELSKINNKVYLLQKQPRGLLIIVAYGKIVAVKKRKPNLFQKINVR